MSCTWWITASIQLYGLCRTHSRSCKLQVRKEWTCSFKHLEMSSQFSMAACLHLLIISFAGIQSLTKVLDREIDLMVALEEMSGDNKSQQASSSGYHECLKQTALQSIQQLLRYFILDQSSEPTFCFICAMLSMYGVPKEM